MLISVIIPTYKPDYSFLECINSLSRQNFSKSNFEVIVILNGIREEYESLILQKLDSTDLIYKYQYDSLPNVSNARNIGLKISCGDYITFIDSDDWVSDNYLEEMYNIIAAQNSLPIANVLCFNEETNLIESDYLSKAFKKGKSKDTLNHIQMRSFFSTPWAKLIHRDIALLKKYDIRFSNGEDALYMFSIEPYLPKRIILTDSAIYFRRLKENSLSRGRNRNEITKKYWLVILEYIKIYIKNINKYSFFFFITRIIASIMHIIRGK